MQGELIRPQEAADGHWLIVDVRSASEFAAEHVPCALHVPLEQLEARGQLFERLNRIALLCKAGTRACMAQERLASQGVEAAVIEGGLDAWKRSGLPTVAGLGTRWSLERQVRLAAGLLVLAGTLAAATYDPRWMALPGFVGLGLTFAGATDICMMGRLLARMPWNRVRTSA